ncbi:MAG: P-type conjugative transfer ATPase TrbB [Synergistaceae bacterium]|nr:P-type conjugative transfer ATPase TrbB [Synergistaceae bacterium]
MPFETEEQLRRLDSKLKRELGPDIVEALENPEVQEVCVNSDGCVWVGEKKKRLYDSGKTISPENLTAALGTIAAMTGAELNGKHTSLEGRLPLDGSRVAGTIPPTTPDGPSMAIRKHASSIFPLSQYVEEERISQEGADYLRAAIRDAKNILVAGGTGSGKTTFVNALIRELLEIAPQDRLLLIEDTVELQCATKNKERFAASEEMPMQKLLKTAMRFSPDRIIIGEVRSKEALDLLKAWNTGHPGGFATVHANDALAALLRLEYLVMEVSENPMPAFIAEAVNIVVYMMEFGSLGRQVTEIIRITGYGEGEYRYEPVYRISGGRKSG